MSRKLAANRWQWSPARQLMESLAEDAVMAGQGDQAAMLPDELPGYSLDQSTTSSVDFPVVGIGASAGGLEALEVFFDNVPSDTRMAFIVVQHLSPDFKSMMAQLLARHTTLTIHNVEQGMRVQPGSVYLIPPKKEMIISGGKLRLTDKVDSQAPHFPIDQFFRSLAQDVGEKAIGVVLSGTGSDGSRGICEIHAAGGLVLVQSESTAKFDGMPKAAIGTGVVDLDLAPADLPGAIVKYGEYADLDLDSDDEDPKNRYFAIFRLLRREYGINFTHYKSSTVQRRIDRRLALKNVPTLRSYSEHLANDPDELNALYRDLLIGVTKFFRDAEAFEHLQSSAIARLLDEAKDEYEFRVWVPGCATGEEAYSLAILIDEALQERCEEHNVRVFATDVHPASLATASRAAYSHESLADVDPERLERYFRLVDGEYHIAKEIRKMVVFAPHNLFKDAPFTKLDLISCRNLLIYLDPYAQKRALSLMHFGLRAGGVLFLGPSETIGPLDDEFESIDRQWRIFRKKSDRRLSDTFRVPMAGTVLGPKPKPKDLPGNAPLDVQILRAYDAILATHMPPGFLIDEKRRLVHSFGGAGRFITVPDGRASANVLDSVCDDLRVALNGALIRAGDNPAVFKDVRIRHGEDDHRYRITAERVRHGDINTTFTLITLEQQDEAFTLPPPEDDYDLGEVSKTHIRELESELTYTRENLQATVEEMETTNEELQATNQELVAANEELQSTNEELHSVNEELYTVNSEYQRKIEELTELSDDIDNLLTSTDVATLFVDREMFIRKFTPKLGETFHLVAQDIGRRINTFAHTLKDVDLAAGCAQVIKTSEPIEREVENKSGRWFLLRIMPYLGKTASGGAVLSLIDITNQKAAQAELQATEEKFADLYENAPDMYVSVDAETRQIVECNHTIAAQLGYARDELVGRDVLDLYHPGSRDAAQEKFAEFLSTGHVSGEEFRLQRADGTSIDVSLNVSAIRDTTGKIVRTRSVWRDISQLKQTRRQVLQREERIRLLLDSAAEGIFGLDRDGVCTFCNRSSLEMLGYDSPDDLVGKDMHKIIHHTRKDGTPRSDAECRIRAAVRSGERVHVDDEVLWRKNGTYFPCEYWSHPIHDGSELVGAVVTFLDISDRREQEQEVQQAVQRRDHFLAMLSHELRNPLGAVINAGHLMQQNPEDEPTLSHALEVIGRQASQMSRLLDDLLDMSRITQGKIDLRCRPIDLTDTTRDAVDAIEQQFRGRGQNLHVELPSESIFVHGDASRLQQVQVNLLNNACKYSPVDAEIWISLARDDHEAVIGVRDEGNGMEPNQLEEVFELFVQNKQTLASAGSGMGIGLTLVRSLVELHGGTVVARSDGPGQGSEFEVRLPTIVAPTPRATRPATDGAETNRRILVVEDIPDSRDMLTALLELDGYEVFTAGTGADALELIEREMPDIAIVDIGLPDIDGFEIARRVREFDSGNEICLIALTGYGQPEDQQRVRDSGFDEHLIKPLQPDVLRRALSRIQSPAARA